MKNLMQTYNRKQQPAIPFLWYFLNKKTCTRQVHKIYRGYSKLFSHVHIAAAQAVSLHIKFNGVNIWRLGKFTK